MSQKWLGLWVLGALLLAGTRPAVAATEDDGDLAAMGQFDILLVGKRIGEEQFRIYKDKKEYEVESKTTRYWPTPSQHEYYYKLENTFQPKELTHHLRQHTLHVLKLTGQGFIKNSLLIGSTRRDRRCRRRN